MSLAKGILTFLQVQAVFLEWVTLKMVANLRNFGHYLRIDIAQYREDFNLQPRESKNQKSRNLKEGNLTLFKVPFI